MTSRLSNKIGAEICHSPNVRKADNLTPDRFTPISLSTPENKKITRRSEGKNAKSSINGENGPEIPGSAITVAVRVRPLTVGEQKDCDIPCVEVTNNNIEVLCDGGTQFFTYDHCFWSEKRHSNFADQQKVYEIVAQPLLEMAFQGYNTSLFAYGQTGSGKSYSIMGHQQDSGIIPRFCQDLFERIQMKTKHGGRICVEISYFEIYNEKIHDLLSSNTDRGKKAPMRVREHPVLGPYIVDLSTFVVSCYDDLEGWLNLGNKQRATAATCLNNKSSRSHSVFTIVLTQTKSEWMDGDSHEHVQKSKINIVDLAGSERVSNLYSDSTFKESVSINRSLLTLGKVISQLAESSTTSTKKKIFVPYRESVLTWLLKESLGGNSQTTMLATISPCIVHIEETLSTLRYAKQARTIVNIARVNEDPKAKLIRELRAEIERLKTLQCLDSPGQQSNTDADLIVLKERLLESEQLLAQTTRTWQEKLEQAEKRKAEEADNLTKSGIAFKIDNQLPNLVNLNEDPQLSETLLYLLREGNTTVGREGNEFDPDIKLRGTLISCDHCIISNNEGVVKVIPQGTAQTYVNGSVITKATILYHGDRVVIGGHHYFRFNNPLERDRRVSLSGKDFQFARNELMAVQEERLRVELEKTREKTRQEMLEEIESIKREAACEISSQKHHYEDRLHELQMLLDEHKLETEIADVSQRRIEIEPDFGNLDMSLLKTDILNEIAENLSICEESLLTVPFKQSEDTTKHNIFSIHLMIEEANQLLRTLHKNYIFCQHDLLGQNGIENVIRIRDETNDLVTTWTVDKFLNKLQNLRTATEDDEDIDLFDAGDEWFKNDRLTMTLSPKMIRALQRNSPTRNSISSSCRSFSSQVSPLKTGDGSKKGIFRQSMNRVQLHLSTSCAEICKEHMLTLSQTLADTNSGTVPLLEAISLAKTAIVDILEAWNSDPDKENIQKLSLKLSTAIEAFAVKALGFVTAITSELACSDITSPFMKSVERIANAASFLFQGISKNVDALVQESASKVLEALQTCSRKIGEMCPLMDTSILRSSTLISQNVAVEIGSNFLEGLFCVFEKTLQVVTESFEDAELRASFLVDDSFFGVMKDSKDVALSYRQLSSAITTWLSELQHHYYADVKQKLLIHSADLSSKCHLLNEITSLLGEVSGAVTSLCNCVEKFVKGGKFNPSDTYRIAGKVEDLIKSTTSLLGPNPPSPVLDDQDISPINASGVCENFLESPCRNVESATNDFKRKLKSSATYKRRASSPSPKLMKVTFDPSPQQFCDTSNDSKDSNFKTPKAPAPKSVTHSPVVDFTPSYSLQKGLRK